MACRAPGTKRLMVIVFRVTISSRGKESMASKLITNCSASTAGVSGSTGPQGERVLERGLRGWLCGPILGDAGIRAPQIRLVGGLARSSRCNACLDLLLHQW